MSILAESSVLAGRSLRFYLRNPAHVISTFAFPIMLLLTQLAVLGRIVQDVTGRPYVDRIAPLVVLSTAAFGSAVTAAAVHRDLHSGLFARIRTMPVAPLSLVAGRVLGDLGRVLAVAVATVAVALLLGFRFSAGPVAALGFVAVVALFGLLCTAVGILAGIGGGSEESVQAALSAPATLLFLLSSGFVPVEAFPGALQPVVRANPLSTATEALVGLSAGGPVAAPVLQTAAWTAGGLVLLGVLGARRHRALAGG